MHEQTDDNNIPTYSAFHGNPVDQESMPPDNSMTNKPVNNTKRNTPNDDSSNNSNKTHDNEGDTNTNEDDNNKIKLHESNNERDDHEDDTTSTDQNGRDHTNTKNHSYSTRAKKPLQYDKVIHYLEMIKERDYS